MQPTAQTSGKSGKLGKLSPPMQTLHDRVGHIADLPGAINAMSLGFTEQFRAASGDQARIDGLCNEIRTNVDEWTAACIRGTSYTAPAKAGASGGGV